MSCLRLFSSALYNQLVNITSAAILFLVIYTMEHCGKERVKGHRAVLTTPITVLNYQERVELRHLRQPLHHDPSAFCRVILGGKCAHAGIKRDGSSLVENTVPFDTQKFRKSKPEFLVEWNAPYNFPAPPFNHISGIC